MRKMLVNSVWLIAIILLLSACEGEQVETKYYMSLMGESDTWKLNGYEIMLTSDGEKAGNGKLSMKGVDEYVSDIFSFRTHAVIDGEDTVIHGGSVSGQTDIAQQTTGTIVGEGGKTITIDEVSSIYMMIEWWDTDENIPAQERIDLYRKPEDGETFLQG
ncbi:hypothetical protein ACFOGI_02960 [Virgibacillus xinjiangensis]|uniref:Uncharacterized protein n=1 Tax=Virgibacillus xinjiangensis TaxID=393090 RepID=A0ABV7CSB0_9BACI